MSSKTEQTSSTFSCQLFKFLREIKPDLESLSFSKSQIEKPVQKVETSSPRM